MRSKGRIESRGTGADDGFFVWTVLELVVVGLLAVTCVTTLLGNAAQLWRQTAIREQALQIAISAIEEGKAQIMLGGKPSVGSWKKGNFLIVAEEEPVFWKGVRGELYQVSIYRDEEVLVELSTTYVPV